MMQEKRQKMNGQIKDSNSFLLLFFWMENYSNKMSLGIRFFWSFGRFAEPCTLHSLNQASMWHGVATAWVR